MEEIVESKALSGCRVLVVEDEYYLADDLRRAARALGAEVIGPAPTRERALGLVDESKRIDLAVLDVNLRGETAYAVADALEARGVPFVFATGYDEGTVPDRFAGVPCWTKPIEPDDLLRCLSEARANP